MPVLNRLGAVLALGGSIGLLVVSSTQAAPPEDPTIERTWVTGITHSDATIHALIHPNGSLTAHQLEIDTTGNFRFSRNDGCLLHLPGVMCTQALVPGDPLAPGLVLPVESRIPAGCRPQRVSVNMADIGATLQPGTKYHYRAIAANRPGHVVEGPARTFLTPTIESSPGASTAERPRQCSTASPPAMKKRRHCGSTAHGFVTNIRTVNMRCRPARRMIRRWYSHGKPMPAHFSCVLRSGARPAVCRSGRRVIRFNYPE